MNTYPDLTLLNRDLIRHTQDTYRMESIFRYEGTDAYHMTRRVTRDTQLLAIYAHNREGR